MILQTLTLLTALLIAACSSSSSSSNGDFGRPNANAITTILREPGHSSPALEAQTTTVVNSRDELARLWSRIYEGQSPVPPMPEVDFSRESVVLASPGIRNSGGYEVEIERLEEIPEGMRLVIRLTSPGSSCMVTDALTTPIHLVRTRRLPAVTMFEWREVVRECE